MSEGKIVMIVSGFPRRSETFALNEIWALENRGALAAFSLQKQASLLPHSPPAKPFSAASMCSWKQTAHIRPKK